MLTIKRQRVKPHDDEADIILADSPSEMAAELIAAYKSHPRPVALPRNLTKQKFTGRRFGSLQSATSAVSKPWPNGLQIIQRMLEDLRDVHLPQPRSRKRRRRFSEDDGDDICFDRLRSGQPYWLEHHRQNVSAPSTVTIVADVCANANVDHERILWRGAAAVTLTYLLEQAGYRVELWSAYAADQVYRDCDASCCAAACIKRTSDPLDIGSAASAVSAWFFRCFAIFSGNFAQDRQPENWCGMATDIKPYIPHITPDERTIVVERVWSYGEAIDWIRGNVRCEARR